MLLTARLLLTLSALMVGLAPIIADLSHTHAFNPDWPGHARFHVVWKMGILACLGLTTLVLAWRRWPNPVRMLRIATLPGWIVLGSFFLAAMTMPQYDGTLRDDPTLPDIMGFDGNLFLFSIATLLLTAATVLALRAKEPA